MYALDQCWRQDPMPSGPFLIPAVGLYEMSKGANPRAGWRESLLPFTRRPELLYIAHAPITLLKQEIESGFPIQNPINKELTATFRFLLGKPDWLDILAGDSPLQFVCSFDSGRDLGNFRISTEETICAIEQHFGPAKMARIRHESRIRDEVSKYAVELIPIVDQAFVVELGSLNVPEQVAFALSDHASFSWRIYFTYWIHAMQVAMKSRLLQRKDRKLRNDYRDSEYASIASYCKSLYTADCLLLKRFDALRAALSLSEC
ncbi:MAG: hypothetical protein P1U82_27255 [Verrucomicrobiales bacterium]|nr:hypothetical protein [Verrucomicrobiales bacterium]